MRNLKKVGDVFGKWTLIEKDTTKKNYWICRCSCGTVASIFKSTLRREGNFGCKRCMTHRQTKYQPGQVFGKWTLIERDTVKGGHWICRCSCGTVASVYASRFGREGSLGCISCAARKSAEDLTGLEFGRWTVLEKALSRGPIRKRVMWLCRCKCGNISTINGDSLRAGSSKSCGCLQLDSVSLPEKQAAINKIYSGARSGARDRGLVWSLPRELVEYISQQPCNYCGKPPSNTSTSSLGIQVKYSGIDRVDNSRGYEEDNVVPCCKNCNAAKRDRTADEFLSWANRIVNHNKTKEANGNSNM